MLHYKQLKQKGRLMAVHRLRLAWRQIPNASPISSPAPFKKSSTMSLGDKLQLLALLAPSYLMIVEKLADQLLNLLEG